MNEQEQPMQPKRKALDAEARARMARIVEILSEFGADDPQSWALSEVRENIPQLARFLLLHEIRQNIFGSIFCRTDSDAENAAAARRSDWSHTIEGERARQRLLDAGVNELDLVKVARAAACAAVFQTLCILDGTTGGVTDAPDAPYCILMEALGEPGDTRLTGRVVGGLHESFGSLYETDD